MYIRYSKKKCRLKDVEGCQWTPLRHGSLSQGLSDTASPPNSLIPHDLILRHVAVLFDEFLVKQDIINAIYGNWRRERPYDHLNWSGQKLYESLKKEHGKVKQ